MKYFNLKENSQKYNQSQILIKFFIQDESKRLNKEGFSKIYKLMNSLNFNNETYAFQNVKISDSLIIKYNILNEVEDKKENCLIIKIKELKKESEEDVVWKIGNNSYISLLYELISSKTNMKNAPQQIIKNEKYINKISKTFNIGDMNGELYLGGQSTCSTNSTAKGQNNVFQIEKYYKSNQSIESSPMIVVEENKSNLIKQNKLLKKEEINTDKKRPIKICKDNNNASEFEYQILEDNDNISNQNNIFSKDYISKLNYSEYEYDTFCQCVIVTGLKFGKVNLIEKSEELPASCGHKECSILQSATPSILHSYQNPNKKYQIDINDLTPSLVFPLGIKICMIYDSIHQYPKQNKPFINRIENKKGESFYIVSLIYYKQMTIKKYEERYKINPLLSYSNNTKNINFEKEMAIISKLALNETIFVPECISLISRFPYFYQMNQCLKSLILLNDNKKINLLINHLINQVPVPYKNQEIMFYIPNNPIPIKILSPYLFNIYNYQSINIFNYFSNQNIITIFYLVLLEQQILFIDKDLSLLSLISYLFINLIYPFSWSNTYIPILSISSIKFLESIIPYIMGVEESLVGYALENQYIGNKVIFVNISKNDIYLSNKKRINLKTLCKLLDLPKFPEHLERNLNKKLDEIKNLKNNSLIAENLRYIFCKLMVVILSDYLEHCFVIDDDIIFNNESFIERKKPEEKGFYKEIIQTQLFSQFLLSRKEQFIKNKKIIKYRSLNDYDKKEVDFESFLQDTKITSNIYGNMYDNLYFDYNLFHKFEKGYLYKNEKYKIKNNNLINEIKTSSIPNDSELNKSTKYQTKLSLQNIKSKKSSPRKKNLDIIINDNLNKSYKRNSIFSYKTFEINSQKSYKMKKVYETTFNTEDENEVKNNDLDYSFENSKKYKEIILKQKKHENESRFLLYPYFLEKQDNNMTNENKDSYIKNRIKEIIKLDEEINRIIKIKDTPNYILPSYKRYEFFSIAEDYKKYFPNSMRNYVNNGENRKDIYSDFSSEDEENDNDNNNHNKKRSNYYNNNSINLKNNMDSKELNYINEWFNTICSADKKKLKGYDINNFVKLLLSKNENISYFSDLIFQDYIPIYKYLKESGKKYLTYECLNDLYKVIIKILPNLKSKDYFICKQLTLSLFIYGYYSQKFKQNRFIISKISDFFHSSIVLIDKVCPLWGEIYFWNFWFLNDLETKRNNNYFINIERKGNEEDLILNLNTNDVNSEYEFIFDICNIMILLGKNKNFIKNCIFDKVASKYLTQFELEDLEKIIFSNE